MFLAKIPNCVLSIICFIQDLLDIREATELKTKYLQLKSGTSVTGKV
jgi:hypothetical protein